MKAIIIIYVALLPSIIHGVSDDENQSDEPFTSSDEEEEVDDIDLARIRLDEMVANGENISNLFKPTAFIVESAYCTIFEGQLLRNGNKRVAMKFSPSARPYLRKEYKMYTYLNAIDNATVENFGIPAVYYYGEWGRCLMLAITLLEKNFHIENDWSDLNVLIVFREYMRISKYIHSRGIYHSDSRYGNMMFRGNRGFMIDFKWAKKLPDRQQFGDYRREDWKTFVFNLSFRRGLRDDTQINALPEGPFKRVLIRFGDYAYHADEVDYDEMHGIITEEIRNLRAQEPTLVSSLITARRSDERNPIPDIRDIPDPYTAQFDYPKPNYAYFA